MPIARFEMPDGRVARFEVPAGLSPEDAQNLISSSFVNKQPDAPLERTFGEAAKDIGAGITSGVGSLVQLPGQLYGLATGNFEDTGLLGLGKSIAKSGEEMKSEALKQKEAQRSQRIQEAEKKGQWEAFKTAAGETIKDPALLTSFLAEQAPQMIVPFGAAKVGKALTMGKGLGAGLAAEEAAQAAGTAGTRAAIGAGAVQQGADIGTGTYENVYKTLADKGTPQEEAKSQALNLARASGASGAIISLLAQKLPGAKTLEESFAGVPGTTGRLLGAAKGALGEATSEVAEETGGKFTQNLAMRQVSPEQELTQGLGATAGMAAIGGAGFGGVAGGLRTPQGAPQPAQATQPSPVVPEAPQIDPDKYRSAIEQLRANIPEAGISDAQKIADIFKTAGIQDETEISSYVKQATDNGDIKAHISPFFDVKNADGTTLFRTTEQAIADKAAERLNAEEPNKASVAPIEITTLRNNAGYPPGYDIKQGRFKQQEFDIVSGDIVLSPKSMTMDDVDQKAQRLAEIRKDGIKGIDKEVKGLQEKVNQNNLSVESMEAEGQANTPEYATLSQQVVQDNLAIQKSIEELTAKKTSFTAPLLVRPAKASDEGFTVFQNGKPLYYFPTLEQAEETVDAAPTSVPTQEAIAAKEALRQTLLPFMKQVGLEGTGLRIMDSIESAQGSGDGYYAQNLIAIALSAPNPMATLRHETIHALKELGAFTDQEWKLLESTAKKDWINRFIKNRNTQDGKSLYEAYKAIYLQDKGNLEGFDSYITEEAIADAFKYFNANGTPPGMLSQIFAKIKAFLESLGNQFSGLGFQTADQVFKRVEMGQMRPTRAAPVGNAPRYQEEEPKYSVSPAPEGVPKKAQTTSTAPTAVAKAPAAVAVTPTAVAVTNRAKPTKVMSMEDLGKVIPASERVVSKNPSRLLNGKKFSKANLNKVGEGFFIYKEYGESDAEGLVKKIWEDSIADVEDFVSGSRVGTFIQDLVKSLGAKPPTAKFLNDSFSLSDSARYWYETSAEALDQTTLNIKNKDLLINLISATSQNVPPLPNMRRGISVMSEYTQGKPIETDLISKKPVADAISNRDIQTLKFGNFADTMKFINGYTPNPPVSTNDRQVAAIFNMQPDEFAKNPVLYAVVSKFYAKIRDSQNKMQGEGKQPYESWQIQALNWVEERGNNTSYGTKTADSYDQAIEVITEQLKNAGIPLEKGKIGMSTLKDPRVPNLLSGTMDVFQDAVKATVESNTLLNKSGSEANQEYEKIKDINEPWARNLRKEFLMIQTRVLKKLSSSKAIETIAKLATGQNVKAFAMSRMDATARGTFEGNLSPNIRIPMFYRNGATKTLITDPEINFILSVLGSGLDQAAMAGSLFKPDINGETYRVFLPDRKITDDEATTFEKNVGFPLNLYDVPNGAVVEINIGGYDTRPTAASVQAALNATFGNNVNAKIAKASYKSTYLTKEKIEYAPSYREVIYDYRDSKFGRGNKNGFRRAFDDRLTTIAKQLIAIARERDGQFGKFTKDSREKRTAYEQKIGSKTDWAVMGGPSGGKYQLTAARINVDGVMRPTRNSRGAFIATTPEGIQNFWRWFGNSIMVDSKGFPRVMMHGTARDFERFMPKQAEAIFVTDEPFFSQNFSQLSEDWIAKNYDDPSVGLTDEDIKDAKRETLSKMDDLTRREYGLNMKTDPQKFIEYGIDEWRTAVLNRAETRANTVPLYVKLENPFNYQNKDHVKMVVDEMTKDWNGNTHKFKTDTLHLIETTISKRQLDGYLSMGDWGYIEHPETIAAIKNLDFDGITMREDMADKNYAVFKQTNVKSAVGNLGAFGQRELTQAERKAEGEREGKTVTAKEAKIRQAEGYIRYSISSPDTQPFKRWFKDSRVVDKDGNPLVMYHATKTPEEGADLFSVFNKSDDGKLGQGIYTTAVEKYAESFAPNGVVMPLWVSIQNPLYLDLTASIQKGRSARDILRSKIAGEEPSREVDYLRLDGNGSREISNGLNAEIQAITGKRMMDMSGASIKRALQKAGYDGIIVRDTDGNFVEVNAFDQTQIKSAVGNRGTYSESNKDIRYSIRDAFDADFNATFGTAGNDALNRATYVRQEKGFAQRIAEAISPDSVTAIRQKLFNKYEAVERLSKMVAADTRPGFLGAKELLADVSANAAALQADRAAGVAAEALMNGIPVYEKGYTKVTDMGGKVKGLIPILEPLLKKYQHPKILQMFQFYSATRRGIRLYNEGREHVLTPADFTLGDAFEVKYPEFKTAYAEYQKFNEGLVKFLIDTGVLSKAMGAEWTKYGDYIPFYRQIDGETTVGPKMFQNLSNIKITPELTGGDKQIGDYLETVVRNTRSAIEQGMKNVAAQRIVRDIMRLNTQGMNDMGRKLQPHEKSGSDVVTVRENGDDVRYQVIDPLLVESMKSLHNMGINSFWTLMSYPTQLLRNLVTKEPSFILANLARDSMQAWVTSGVSMTPLVDTFKQFGKVLANQSPEAKALRAAGIGTGYEFSGDIKSSAKAVADALNDRAGIKTNWQKAMWPVSKVWDALDKGSNASDLATRAEIYKKVLAETGNEAEAIYQSLEVMNFGRMGSSPMIQVISALVPFFNARVQGMDVLYRAGFGRMATQNSKAQHKAFMYRALFIAAMSSLYWFMARDTDEWKRASKEVRDNYWLIGNVKIPIPFEIGVLFKVAPERILEAAFGNDTGGDLAESALRNIISTLKINPVPQAFLPILEESVNYSLFTGMPIVGRGMENVAAPYQRNSSTTELSIMLGEQLNLSPIRIDHVLSAYTGSMGMYMAQMIGGVVNTVSGSEATRPAMSIEQTPILKRFFASDKAGGTIDAFYSLKKEVDVMVRTQHELQSRGNPEQYAEYMEKNGQLLGLKGLVSSIDRQLTQFRELRNKIQFSSLDPQEKRETLDNIRYAEIAITENIKEIKKNALQ